MSVQTGPVGSQSCYSSFRRLGGAAMLLLATFGAGCQSSRTFVLNEPMSPTVFHTAQVRPAPSMMMLPAEEQKTFESALLRNLQAKQAFAPGDELTLEYRVVLRDAGSSGARIGAAVVSLTGVPTGAIGQGNLGVDVTYKDRQGRELGRVLADGPIDGPVATTNDGLKKAADSLAKFTIMQFSANDPTAVMLANKRASMASPETMAR